MFPAHQRFYLTDLTGFQVDDRLVMQLELAVVQSAMQIRLQFQAFDSVCVHAVVENDATRLALRLGLVHGSVRVAQERVCVFGAAGAEGDPQAAHGEDFPPFQMDWGQQLPRDPVRYGGHIAHAVNVFQEKRKLVAAQPSDGIAGPKARLEALRYRHEQSVSGVMAEAVIDDFEVV